MRGTALDSKNRILARIGDQPRAVWTAVDFLDFGPRAAVDKALQRLASAGVLHRIDRGLYAQPRVSNLTGKSSAPDTRAVLDAIARRDQARLVVDGLTAANDLGLTTAVPARILVLTDARVRPIHLGNQVITFRRAAPSRLYWAGRPAMRVVQALHWLKDTVPSDRNRILHRLRSVLSDPQNGLVIRDDLRDGLRTLPIWMQSLVRDVLRDEQGHDYHRNGAAKNSHDSSHNGSNQRKRRRRTGTQPRRVAP